MTNFIPTLSKCNGGAKNFKQLVSTTAAPTACQYVINCGFLTTVNTFQHLLKGAMLNIMVAVNLQINV